MPEQQYRVQPGHTLGAEYNQQVSKAGDIVTRSMFSDTAVFDRFVELGAIKPITDPAHRADTLRRWQEAQIKLAELQLEYDGIVF